MTHNRDTVLQYIDAFRSTDRERVLSLVTNDVVWKIPGAFEIKGRSAFAAHIVDEGFRSNPEITVERLVEGPDVVVVEGIVRTERTDGTVLHLAFCDLFEIRDTKIARLTSYLVQIPHNSLDPAK